MFIAEGSAQQYITIDLFKQCLQYGEFAELFDVEAKILKQAVRRNIHRTYYMMQQKSFIRSFYNMLTHTV